MLDKCDDPTDLSRLVVPVMGSLDATRDPFQPYRLLDAAGVPVAAVDACFAELSACSRPATTQRSYGMDLLRWFRFLAARNVNWDRRQRPKVGTSAVGSPWPRNSPARTGGG